MKGSSALIEEARVCERRALINVILAPRYGWSAGYVYAMRSTARLLRRHAALVDGERSPFERLTGSERLVAAAAQAEEWA